MSIDVYSKLRDVWLWQSRFALFCIIVFIFVAPFLSVSSGLVFVNVSFSSGYLLTFFTHDTRVIWYLWLKIYFMSNIPNIPQGGLPLPFHWLLYTSHEERTQGRRQTVRWKEKDYFSSCPYWFQVSRVTLTWLTSGTWSIRHSKNWRKKRNKLFVGTILIKNGTISMKVGTIAVR